MSLPMTLYAQRQGVDVGGVVMVVVHEAQLGQVAHLGSPGVDRVEQAGRGGGRVLWVSRHHQDPGHALGLQEVELVCNGLAAIAHGKGDPHPPGAAIHPVLQAPCLPLGPDLEGRALGHPDTGVFGS